MRVAGSAKAVAAIERVHLEGRQPAWLGDGVAILRLRDSEGSARRSQIP